MNILMDFLDELDQNDLNNIGHVTAIDRNSHGEITFFHRHNREDYDKDQYLNYSRYPLLYSKSKNLEMKRWGKDLFVFPHGFYIDGEDHYGVTDTALHQVFRFNPNKECVLMLGIRKKRGCCQDTFDKPTDVVFVDDKVYITDGYGNSRVVVFDLKGNYCFEWGEAGDGPGQFNLPHSITSNKKDILYVLDRENHRIQLFDLKGNYLDDWKGEHYVNPWGLSYVNNGFIYVVDKSGYSIKVDEKGKVLSKIKSAYKSHDVLMITEKDGYIVDCRQKAERNEGFCINRCEW